MSKAGLDNRLRNKDGEISHKQGNTLIRRLRKVYGQGFAAEPSRHRIVRQACLGRSRAICLAEIRSGSSRRPVLFSGLPLRLGPVPGGHTRIFG